MSLAPELALGIADGNERAQALEHMAGCLHCRDTVAGLSDIADEVLLIAPVQKPRPTLEGRVLRDLGFTSRRPRRIGVYAVAAAMMLVAVVVAAGMHIASSESRQLATHYRRTLEESGGRYFGAVALREHDGEVVGHVYVYRGSPSWLFVSVSSGDDSEPYGVEVVTTEGRRVRLGSFRIIDGRGGWGKSIPGEVGRLAALRLLERREGESGSGARSFTELDSVANLRHEKLHHQVGP